MHNLSLTHAHLTNVEALKGSVSMYGNCKVYMTSLLPDTILVRDSARVNRKLVKEYTYLFEAMVKFSCCLVLFPLLFVGAQTTWGFYYIQLDKNLHDVWSYNSTHMQSGTYIHQEKGKFVLSYY